MMKHSLSVGASILVVLSMFGCAAKDTQTSATLPDGTRANVTTESDGSGMTLESGGTNAAMGTSATVTEEQLGLPFYPGAKMIADRTMSLKTPNEESYSVAFTSTDDVEKIAAFYTERVKGLEFTKTENAGAVSMFSKELVDARKGKVMVVLMRKGASEPVEIQLAWGKTQ